MFKASKLLAVFVAFLLTAPAAWAQSPGCPDETPQAKKARSLYEEALIQEATGNLGAAREMYDRLVKDHPGSLFACWAKVRLTALREGKARVNKEGRASFIIGTTLFGTWGGLAIVNIAALGDDHYSDTEEDALIWGSIIGAAAGIVPAILFSSDIPMSTGRATLINFGWGWGMWHGFAFSLMPMPDLDPQVMFGLALGLSALGWGAAFTATHFVDVADGDAALVAAAAGWFTWYTWAIGALISEDFLWDEDVTIPVILVGGDAGVATAALLSGRLDMSAGRVGLINLGGFLGALLAGGILVLAKPDNYRAGLGAGLGFTSAGLVGAWLLTKGYDEPGNGSTGLAALEYTPDGWAVGAPLPRIAPAWVDGQRRLTFEVPLIGGRF